MKRPKARLIAVLERCSTGRFHEPLKEMGIRLLDLPRMASEATASRGSISS
jgi:hypothetical protein